MPQALPRTVLVADDESRFAADAARLLEESGFRCVVGRSAFDALVASGEPIAAGIVDVFFPDGPDGLDLCAELRRRQPGASITMTSHVFAGRGWRAKAAALGADCFFDKAWPLEVLGADVRFVVDGLRPTLATGRELPPDAPRAVVADDDERWRAACCFALERAGILPYEAGSGRRALLAVGRLRPDVAVLGHMMPDYTGPECLEYIRRNPRTARVPVVVTTDVEDAGMELACLSLGASDVVQKHRQGVDVLAARVLKMLKPSSRGIEEPLRAGPFALDPRSRLVHVGGRPAADVTVEQFDLLRILVEEAGKVVAWEDVERRLHPGLRAAPGAARAPAAMKTLVHRLKGKLGEKYGSCVVTWRGLGLQLDVQKAGK